MASRSLPPNSTCQTFKRDVNRILEMCKAGKPVALVCHCAPQNCHGYAITRPTDPLHQQESNNNRGTHATNNIPNQSTFLETNQTTPLSTHMKCATK